MTVGAASFIVAYRMSLFEDAKAAIYGDAVIPFSSRMLLMRSIFALFFRACCAGAINFLLLAATAICATLLSDFFDFTDFVPSSSSSSLSDSTTTSLISGSVEGKGKTMSAKSSDSFTDSMSSKLAAKPGLRRGLALNSLPGLSALYLLSLLLTGS